jgi:hypothetical protein
MDFEQTNPLKDVDSRVFTRMLRGKNLTPWPLTLKINRVPDSPKDYVCTKFGQNPLKDLILECSQGCYAIKIWPGDIVLIFKVKGQCHRVKFWLRSILVNTLESDPSMDFTFDLENQ